MSNNLNNVNAKFVFSSKTAGVIWGSNNQGYNGMTVSQVRKDLHSIADVREDTALIDALRRLANAPDLTITTN
ncbi:hypothetical protein [Photobacterium sp. GSS17]|uniref:hypothetical protein n=1 Tax=Photobacterium sp. GSS17 TaxID=3020715 RepID=UPI002361E9D3|nr:hypothetical protein [Photobacterium sp. GSS17]